MGGSAQPYRHILLQGITVVLPPISIPVNINGSGCPPASSELAAQFADQVHQMKLRSAMARLLAYRSRDWVHRPISLWRLWAQYRSQHVAAMSRWRSMPKKWPRQVPSQHILSTNFRRRRGRRHLSRHDNSPMQFCPNLARRFLTHTLDGGARMTAVSICLNQLDRRVAPHSP